MLLVAVAVALHDLLTDECGGNIQGKAGSGAFTTVLVGEMLEKILVIYRMGYTKSAVLLGLDIIFPELGIFNRHLFIPSAYKF